MAEAGRGCAQPWGQEHTAGRGGAQPGPGRPPAGQPPENEPPRPSRPAQPAPQQSRSPTAGGPKPGGGAQPPTRPGARPLPVRRPLRRRGRLGAGEVGAADVGNPPVFAGTGSWLAPQAHFTGGETEPEERACPRSRGCQARTRPGVSRRRVGGQLADFVTDFERVWMRVHRRALAGVTPPEGPALRAGFAA